MPDLQTEVEFLAEELQNTRQELMNTFADRKVLRDICQAYHAILFETPPQDFRLVLKAVALGLAATWDNEKPRGQNYITQDVFVESPKPLRLNITVQRIEGKSPSEVLGEYQTAVAALIAALALHNPTIASKLPAHLPGEIPALLKDAALAADRSE